MRLHKFLKDYLDSFIYLIFPELCIICDQNDREIHDTFCLDCYSKLPFTDQSSTRKNQFTQHFDGKINIEHGAALFYFIKQGHIQELIQKIKYKNKPDYGVKIGELFGYIIKDHSFFENIDLIVPVPLHSEKEKRRGYNQSLTFAEGISRITSIPIAKSNLIRNRSTSTQTKMNREQRLVNLKNAFTVQNPNAFAKKHILLIDDVLTTGATLMECGMEILKCNKTKISMATIAMGELMR